jgi:uncharacterized protein YecA (UPF0149 family)
VTVTAKQRPVLAWCATCDAPFHAGQFGGGSMGLGPRGQAVYIGHASGGTGSVNLRDSMAQCPICGTMGRIQDGLYDTVLGVVKESARIFRSFTPEEAAVLAAALKEHRQDHINEEAVVEASPPEAKGWIKQVLSKADKKFWAGVLLTVLVAVQSNLAGDSSTHSLQAAIASSAQATQQQIVQSEKQDQQLRRIVQELVDQNSGELRVVKQSTLKAQPPATAREAPETPANRNQPCWCGSGRKFKRCHRGTS